MIDWNKPLQVDGARCDCVSCRASMGDFNRIIIARCRTQDAIYYSDNDGNVLGQYFKVTNIPEKKEFWVNVKPDAVHPDAISYNDYDNKDQALQNRGSNAIGTLHITFSDDVTIKPTIEWVAE